MFILIMICNFLLNFVSFCVIASFFITLLTLGILFSIAVRALAVAGFLTFNLIYFNTKRSISR